MSTESRSSDTYTVEPQLLDRESARELILTSSEQHRFRKATDILAVRMANPFRVLTDQGVIGGNAGDWLVTNDPDGPDTTSDAWPISDQRMLSSYAPADRPDGDPEYDPIAEIGLVIGWLTVEPGQGASPDVTVAIRKLEEARFWLERACTCAPG